MTEKKLSTLGYLMDRLGLSSAGFMWMPVWSANGAAGTAACM